ncbi:uncharacterized protein RSE6_09734 [Rhynchosporium secalis]|uniref:Uncharacterized protein n=1 Tax=Rhynchosporium secalis TaxID=38038 RepID=A0A1E1MIK7_RHYSE|nr:uncharacterized protein RSE6_09734 [Rhynchosporium secalis]
MTSLTKPLNHQITKSPNHQFNQPGIVRELSDSPNEILVTRKEMERFGDIKQLVIVRQLGITAPASEMAEFAYSTVRGFASRRTPGTSLLEQFTILGHGSNERTLVRRSHNLADSEAKPTVFSSQIHFATLLNSRPRAKDEIDVNEQARVDLGPKSDRTQKYFLANQ